MPSPASSPTKATRTSTPRARLATQKARAHAKPGGSPRMRDSSRSSVRVIGEALLFRPLFRRLLVAYRGTPEGRVRPCTRAYNASLPTLLRPLSALSAALRMSGCLTAYDRPMYAGRAEGLATVARNLSDEGLRRLTADMDPAMLALARRHDPAPHTDYWGRPAGWETFDLAEIPTLGFGTTFDRTAREINALRPFAGAPINAMSPFVLRASSGDRAQALRCLTQAIYYEAAREPLEGQ